MKMKNKNKFNEYINMNMIIEKINGLFTDWINK
jgi:hypothetical protein